MSVILATQLCHRCFSSKVTNQSAKTKAMLDRMLRVDHAGEYGAVRIYEGQMAVLGRTDVGPVIKVSAFTVTRSCHNDHISIVF